MSTAWRCKSFGEAGRSDPKRTARRRSGASRPTARSALKEAGSETARRRTETGYEAASSRASGHMTAKLSRPRLGDVDPATVRGRSMLLPGEISLAPERATPVEG